RPPRTVAHLVLDRRAQSGVTGMRAVAAGAVALGQNQPNPVADRTTIMFSIPDRATVHLALYDMLGREVTLLADGIREAGEYSVDCAANGLTPGSYLYRRQTGASTL